jgi:hypothetical protein
MGALTSKGQMLNYMRTDFQHFQVHFPSSVPSDYVFVTHVDSRTFATDYRLWGTTQQRSSGLFSGTSLGRWRKHEFCSTTSTGLNAVLLVVCDGTEPTSSVRSGHLHQYLSKGGPQLVSY